MSAQIYQVPVVCNGLREPESIAQIVDALDKLDKVFNDVYTTINSRIQRERGRMESVTGRLNNVQYRVNQVVGSKSAITVFSSARYPTEKKWPDYSPLHADKSKAPFKPSHYHLHGIPFKRNDDNYLEVNDLVFIEKSIDSAGREILATEGLGHLPGHIPSVSNLLLFNTQENPYKKYTNTLDNLQGVQSDAVPQVRTDSKKKKLQAAPVTVEKGDVLPAMEGTNVNYKTVINPAELPTYDFPSALPLRGVAENIGWVVDNLSTIAPSNQVSAALPIFDGQQPSADNYTEPVAATQSVAVQQPQQPTQQIAQQSQQQSNMGMGMMAPQQPVTTNQQPPIYTNHTTTPIQPNIPTSIPATLVHGGDDDDDDDNDEQTSNGSPIGNLLADIRKGHKNRLKKVEVKGGGDDDEDQDEDDKPPPKKGGGDVMSDLFLALSRRRSSIAATKKKGKKQVSDSEGSDDDNEDWKV
ncbi:hypothetical protein DFA_05359 [Cavenderia fasciculata]|uniref:WH2 domain-containing protein n=1 Tax=Cavenderia fasciculata TaxID=261658 RepID=F4PL05_CACFS|nr:uncharacterized protein DFA_05359 [Cavenderia fasciculata]EGG23227.1 hypothetical protein DFA_05359 [Cavenderia fasciculata]|eukprot:XP_004361078.1 hypothetical protein DFA_05359 [Cavenderia fasciculata]